MSRMFPTLCLVLGAVPIAGSAIRAEDYRKVLISTRQNVHVDEWELKSQDLDLATAAPWSVSKHVLHGGKQEGVDVVTINSGEIPMVKIPRVEGMSLREARNRLLAQGLTIEAERADSIPSPYNNTVTRQHPPAGETVPEESGITLWYSRGLGDRYVVLPDVTGMTISEARRALLRRRLRAVVLDRSEGVDDPVVVRQSREPGTRVREGFELRLFTKEE
ncbi:MAG: PASTA domain-containing protein [Bacteroidetes bacterium]|nr:PASTA domain-containing protein [Bacteroidota bacterium]